LKDFIVRKKKARLKKVFLVYELKTTDHSISAGGISTAHIVKEAIGCRRLTPIAAKHSMQVK